METENLKLKGQMEIKDRAPVENDQKENLIDYAKKLRVIQLQSTENRCVGGRNLQIEADS